MSNVKIVLFFTKIHLTGFGSLSPHVAILGALLENCLRGGGRTKRIFSG
jgi:hypothetical protein